MEKGSCTKTGKKDGDSERASPCTQVQHLRIQRDIVVAEVPPEERGVNPTQTTEPEHQGWEEEPAQHLAAKISENIAGKRRKSSCRCLKANTQRPGHLPGALVRGEETCHMEAIKRRSEWHSSRDLGDRLLRFWS